MQSLRAFYADGLEVEFGFAAQAWAKTHPVDDGTAQVIRDAAVILVDKQLHLAQLARSVQTESS